MLKEPVETTVNPTSLSDLDLLRFAEEYVYKEGIPRNFQRELVRRFADKIVLTRSY